MFRFLRIGRERIKLVDFLSKRPFFFLLPPRFLGKDGRSFAHCDIHSFLIRTYVRANGYAPAHRALSEFEILAFTLHLHPQFVDTVCVAGEEKGLFPPSPGEGNRGETFTHKSLFPSRLQSYGEEVKTKNEKQRTRALRVRVRAEVGGQCTFEKGFPVVETRTFKIEVQQIIRFFIGSNP